MARPMHGSGGKPEKVKDFKGSIKRLLKELRDFRGLIILSIILAIGSSILSIATPNRLSDMVDEISHGIAPQTQNIEAIAKNIQDSMKKASESGQGTSPNSPGQGQMDPSQMDPAQIPDQVANQLVSPITIDGVEISGKDQLIFASMMKNFKPTNGQKTDQATIDQEAQVRQLAEFDKLPENIKAVIYPKMDFIQIKNLAILIGAFYILSSVFQFIQSISMTVASNGFAKKLRKSISTKINDLPLCYFDKHPVGDILSRVTNDIDTIAQSMNQSMASLVAALVLFLGTMIMMFITNWQLALTAIISSMLGFIFMFIILGKSQKYFTMRQKALGDLNGHIEEIYSGLNIVKVYNAKDQVTEKFDLANQRVYEANKMSQFLSGLLMPLMNFIGNLGYVAVCIVGAILTVKGKISFGVIVAFISYVRLFTTPLSQIAQAMNAIQSTAASAERVFEFVDEDQMSDQKEITTSLDPEKAQGNIKFENVEFTYDGNSKPTIVDFSAFAIHGQKVAIVGPTGAGKTTMVNLLMKFYEINKGNIIIDGKSIFDLTRENVHDLFTMVLQDTWLFEGTIRENILFNRKDVSEERLQEVIQAVGLDHFIKTLPNGLDSKVHDNDSVSQGQRQLLTIARAMIDDKPFLILDEATSNVDTRSEELVQMAMDKLAQGKTSFIIAHRLSTIKNADLILVMKDGNIIEQGNHDMLMQANGFYADLYNSQFTL